VFRSCVQASISFTNLSKGYEDELRSIIEREQTQAAKYVANEKPLHLVICWAPPK
jgi:hypothetical protein